MTFVCLTSAFSVPFSSRADFAKDRLQTVGRACVEIRYLAELLVETLSSDADEVSSIQINF